MAYLRDIGPGQAGALTQTPQVLAEAHGPAHPPRIIDPSPGALLVGVPLHRRPRLKRAMRLLPGVTGQFILPSLWRWQRPRVRGQPLTLAVAAAAAVDLHRAPGGPRQGVLPRGRHP